MTANPKIEIDETIDTETKYMPLYKVLIHNDDVNTMEHVTRVIMEIFKHEIKKAVEIMLEVHNTGVGLCTVEPLEHAEFHRDQLIAYSLTATIEPD